MYTADSPSGHPLSYVVLFGVGAGSWLPSGTSRQRVTGTHVMGFGNSWFSIACNLPLDSHPSRARPLADLGGVPGAHPLRVQILSFRHMKFLKHNRLGSPPPYEVHSPLREIRDPPLPTMIAFSDWNWLIRATDYTDHKV